MREMNIKFNINKLINKVLSFNVKRTYMVTETNEGYKLVKVMSLYNDSKEAYNDMFDLALNHKNEIEVLGNYK
jgi:hypothetical protein